MGSGGGEDGSSPQQPAAPGTHVQYTPCAPHAVHATRRHTAKSLTSLDTIYTPLQFKALCLAGLIYTPSRALRRPAMDQLVVKHSDPFARLAEATMTHNILGIT